MSGGYDAALDEMFDVIRDGDDERARRLLAEWPSLTREIDVLVLAARQGRVEIVGDLIAAGPPANTCDESGFTPIKVAALAGHREIVRMLIEAGAGGVPSDFPPEAFIRKTIAEKRFYELIATGDVGEMRRLLSEWPTLARLDDTLLLAAEEGQAEAAAILIEAGASLDLDRPWCDNPLEVARDLGHTHIVTLILEAGGAGLDREYWLATRTRR